MILAKKNLSEFASYIKGTYGLDNILYEEKKSDEYGRFLMGASFFVIRDHGPGSEDAETVEVFSSDKKRLEDVENAWAVYLSLLMQEENHDTEPHHQ